jgi:hypothetical protein
VGAHWWRQILRRLCVKHTSRHSPRTLVSPRSRKRRNPRAPLIWPKTGSTITFRRAYNARPVGVRTLAAICSLAIVAEARADVRGAMVGGVGGPASVASVATSATVTSAGNHN